ncbi:MAG: Y-family DNA polymerase [Alteromonadaceae bacterium TMED7]|nr:MAG: Y-family DNA polymerase [Alteromonadaceae bacterium TMED7]|tara:strand:+ start:28975 stop:30240 length:1266 start_codon:yes stop_codon:yes gene_type:complete
MFALIDAVSFYARVEKVFDPTIRNKPVVVLTNNDGCICAVCPMARELGVPKFIPYFKIKDFLAKNHVVVRSSNYELYADLSERMMNVIARYSDRHYVYSIDESFLHFRNFSFIDSWHAYGHVIRKAVWRETRLPVGVGFGTTLTLAKAANHASKKLAGFDGVAVINGDNSDDASRKEILSRMSLTDVWGIGSKLGKRLSILGLKNGWDLANQSPKAMRSQFGVTVERTVNELNGTPCLNWDEIGKDKQELFSTRSFDQRVIDCHSLKAALSSHASIVAKNARRQHSLIKRLVIFASSSPHDDSYYKQSVIYEFPVATDNTLEIVGAISYVFDQIYSTGILFYRCGVGAIALENSAFHQHDMFNVSVNNQPLMQCYDHLNNRYGSGTIEVAAAERNEKWAMRRDFLSPSYTSKWSDIPKIIC